MSKSILKFPDTAVLRHKKWFVFCLLLAKPPNTVHTKLAWLQGARDIPENPAPVLGEFYNLDWESSFDWIRSMASDSCTSPLLKRSNPSLANATKDQHGVMVHADLA